MTFQSSLWLTRRAFLTIAPVSVGKAKLLVGADTFFECVLQAER